MYSEFGKEIGGDEALDGCPCGAFVVGYWSLLPLRVDEDGSNGIAPLKVRRVTFTSFSNGSCNSSEFHD